MEIHFLKFRTHWEENILKNILECDSNTGYNAHGFQCVISFFHARSTMLQVQRKRYFVMALCTAVIGLAAWTHFVINCLILPIRSSCCMQKVIAGFTSSARCANWNKSWNFLVIQNNLHVDPIPLLRLWREQWTLWSSIEAAEPPQMSMIVRVWIFRKYIYRNKLRYSMQRSKKKLIN